MASVNPRPVYALQDLCMHWMQCPFTILWFWEVPSGWISERVPPESAQSSDRERILKL